MRSIHQHLHSLKPAALVVAAVVAAISVLASAVVVLEAADTHITVPTRPAAL